MLFPLSALQRASERNFLFSSLGNTRDNPTSIFHQIQALFVARNRRGLWAGPKH